MPVDDDLKDVHELREGLSWRIGLYGQDASKDTVNNIIVVLHDYGGDHSSVKPMVKKHFADPQTALLCLGGIHRLRPASGQVGGLYWTDEPNGNSYHRAVRLILEHVIGKVLVEKCNFPPSNIALLGHGQGGSVALAIAAIWETTRLGGVITIDGPPPEYIIPSTTPRIPTPVLMVGGRLGALTPQAEQRAKDLFLHVDVDLRPGVNMLPIAQLLASKGDSDEIKTAKDFLAHSLRQEEWETQTVLTFGKSVKVY
jgi:predicted esterase